MSRVLETKVATATASVMAEVRRLKKADNNAFAKYRYTSVDDFKDSLRPLMAKHGLTPNADEVEYEIHELRGDKDKVSHHARFKFELWLEHVSGEKGAREGLTVSLPYVGAQTSGAARSYAIKEWLKSKFLASSGDSEDADQAESDEELSKAEARPIYTELQAELRLASASGEEAMVDWVTRRKPSIDVLPKDWRLQLRRLYKEARATGKAISASSTSEQFLEELEETLARAATADEVEQFFDELDVQSALYGNEKSLAAAFQIKAKRLSIIQKIEA